jgi:polysaccharide export outer membrane protein
MITGSLILVGRLGSVLRARALSRALSLWLVLALAGCAAYTPHPPAEIPGGKQVYRDEVVYLGRDYLLSPGDELEITYHVNVELQDQYRLAIGDQLRVEFFDYPQLDRTLDVRPDGKITIPYKGEIMSVGLTPAELAQRIDQALSELLRNPKSTVTLIRYGQRIRELKDAIKTAARGQSRLALVGPDGRASMPLIAPILVGGKTIEQAEREISAAYARIIPGMHTSATLLTVKGNVFYAFGAINKPGYYELKGPTTVLQGITIAGGFAPSAETSSTLLITRDEENHAVGRLINLAEVMATGNIARDTLLRQADVVFVPNTRLSEAALFGEFIRRMIPVDLVVTYGLSQQVLPAIKLR